MNQIDIIRNMLVGNRINDAPDQTIHDDVSGGKVPYLRRWFLKPKVAGEGNIYLHNFLRSDFDRALHDHPFDSTSILLWGEYKEHFADGTFAHRRSGDIVTRLATDAHRIELIHEQPTWSLFITGPKVREWGFHCESGWVHWTNFGADRCG